MNYKFYVFVYLFIYYGTDVCTWYKILDYKIICNHTIKSVFSFSSVILQLLILLPKDSYHCQFFMDCFSCCPWTWECVYIYTYTRMYHICMCIYRMHRCVTLCTMFYTLLSPHNNYSCNFFHISTYITALWFILLTFF